MQTLNTILLIPADRQKILLASKNQETVYFEGGEKDALRIANFTSPMMGGEYYAYYEGRLEKEGDDFVFHAKDMVDVNSICRVVFGDCVKSILLEWSE